MALHALRRRLRPRTRIKQAIFAIAHYAHRHPEFKRKLVRAVALVPPLDARLRRLLNPQAAGVEIGSPRPPLEYPRGLEPLLRRLQLSRDVARHGAELGMGHGVLSNRLRLACVSPLPPQQSGISDYTVELAKSLSEYYDITLIHEAPETVDPWLATRYAIQTPDWLARNGYSFDRVIYHFGNSAFHHHMPALLQRLPGVVVLHDFYLSGLRLWFYNSGVDKAAWFRSLRESHGWRAVVEAAELGFEEAKVKYPCNKDVLDASLGVLTHSRYAERLAEEWYGLDCADRFTRVPFAQVALVDETDEETRLDAREALGLGEDDFVVTSFGHVADTKRNDALLDAWIAAGLVDDPHAHLVFVGQASGEYGEMFHGRLAALGEGARVRVTGYADVETYARWQQATDLAVQLRTMSRGETSGTIFDCLSRGVPVVLNAHAWAAELPAHAVVRLPDDFEIEALRDVLLHYRADPSALRAQGIAGRLYVRERHAPAVAAKAYHAAIERHYLTYGAQHREVLASVRSWPQATDDELLEIAHGLYNDSPRLNASQWLIDVTRLVDGSAGPEEIEASWALIDALVDEPPAGWRIEPVFFDSTFYRYADNTMLEHLELPTNLFTDDLVNVRPGDRYLSLGLADVDHVNMRRTLESWQRRGTTLNWLLPDVPVPATPSADVSEVAQIDLFDTRLKGLVLLADRLVVPTRALADLLIDKLDALAPPAAPDSPIAAVSPITAESAPASVPPSSLAVVVCSPHAAGLTVGLDVPVPPLPWPRLAPTPTVPFLELSAL